MLDEEKKKMELDSMNKETAPRLSYLEKTKDIEIICIGRIGSSIFCFS